MKARLLGVAIALLAARTANAETPKWFSAEIGAGGMQMTGTAVKDVYGSKNEPAFHMRGGVLIKSILDIGCGGDFAQITGHRVGTVGGASSAETSRLTLGPMFGTALVRLDVLRNQWVVPYAGGGVAYLVWSERNPASNKQVDGDKYGWTAVGGLQILLDTFEPARAADVDSYSGINDTFLTLEISRTDYDRLGRGPTGLDLSHWTGRAAFLFEF